MELDYTVAIDGAPLETFLDSDRAMAEAEAKKVADPEALVTIIVAREGQAT